MCRHHGSVATAAVGRRWPTAEVRRRLGGGGLGTSHPDTEVSLPCCGLLPRHPGGRNGPRRQPRRIDVRDGRREIRDRREPDAIHVFGCDNHGEEWNNDVWSDDPLSNDVVAVLRRRSSSDASPPAGRQDHHDGPSTGMYSFAMNAWDPIGGELVVSVRQMDYGPRTCLLRATAEACHWLRR